MLWDWFLNVSEIEDTPQRKIDEIKKQLKGKSKEYMHMVLNDSKNQFTLQTEYIIRDMAMYFGKVIVKNNETLKWGYHTNIKKDSFANMPSIIGL